MHKRLLLILTACVSSVVAQSNDEAIRKLIAGLLNLPSSSIETSSTSTSQSLNSAFYIPTPDLLPAFSISSTPTPTATPTPAPTLAPTPSSSQCIIPQQSPAEFPDAPFQPNVVSEEHCLRLCGKTGGSCRWNYATSQCVCPPFDMMSTSSSFLFGEMMTTTTQPMPTFAITIEMKCIDPDRMLANSNGFSQQKITLKNCKKLCDPKTGGPCSWYDGICTCQTLGKSQRIDPLFFDLNKNRVIEAAAGVGGVDLNKDGTGDASAYEGDGLLTLYSVDPSQRNVPINITGVFGTDTFNPYAKKIVKTPNGFEALFTLAMWAQVKNPEMKIIDVDNVYMTELNDALLKINYSLGFFNKVGANKKKDIVSLGDVHIVKRKYIARAERSQEFLENQEDSPIKFIEEGRWLSLANKNKEYLCADAYYLPQNATSTPYFAKFKSDDPTGVFSKEEFPDLYKARQLYQMFESKNDASVNRWGILSVLSIISVAFMT